MSELDELKGKVETAQVYTGQKKRSLQRAQDEESRLRRELAHKLCPLRPGDVVLWHGMYFKVADTLANIRYYTGSGTWVVGVKAYRCKRNGEPGRYRNNGSRDLDYVPGLPDERQSIKLIDGV